jgi:hypothetical protein
MNKKHRREKMKNTLTIIILAFFLSWSPNLIAADTNPDAPSQIASAINISTFTLISEPLPARNLQLPFQPTINTKPQQPITPTPQINTKPLRLDKVESALYNTSLITLVALNAADYFSTREALKHKGLSEGNPLMKPFVKNDLTFAAVKLGLTIGNHIFMKNLYRKNKTLAWALSIASNFAMSYVVSHNLKMINSTQSK